MDGTTVAILGGGAAVILLTMAIAISTFPKHRRSPDGSGWYSDGGGSADCSPGDSGGSCGGGD